MTWKWRRRSGILLLIVNSLIRPIPTVYKLIWCIFCRQLHPYYHKISLFSPSDSLDDVSDVTLIFFFMNDWPHYTLLMTSLRKTLFTIFYYKQIVLEVLAFSPCNFGFVSRLTAGKTLRFLYVKWMWLIGKFCLTFNADLFLWMGDRNLQFSAGFPEISLRSRLQTMNLSIQNQALHPRYRWDGTTYDQNSIRRGRSTLSWKKPGSFGSPLNLANWWKS